MGVAFSAGVFPMTAKTDVDLSALDVEGTEVTKSELEALLAEARAKIDALYGTQGLSEKEIYARLRSGEVLESPEVVEWSELSAMLLNWVEPVVDESAVFAMLRRLFWLHLDWKARAQVLEHHHLVPTGVAQRVSMSRQALPQAVENAALRRGLLGGQLERLWRSVIVHVPEAKRPEDPFMMTRSQLVAGEPEYRARPDDPHFRPEPQPIEMNGRLMCSGRDCPVWHTGDVDQVPPCASEDERRCWTAVRFMSGEVRGLRARLKGTSRGGS